MFLFLAPRAEHVRRLKHSEICPYFRSYYGRNNARIISLSIWQIYARFWKVEHISKAIWYWIAFKWTGARNGILNFNSSEFRWILEVQSRYYGPVELLKLEYILNIIWRLTINYFWVCKIDVTSYSSWCEKLQFNFNADKAMSPWYAGR